MSKREWKMRQIPIKEMKSMLLHVTDENDPIITMLANDSRKGALHLLEKWKREKLLKEQDIQRFQKMCEHEMIAREQGFQLIAGIDEAGRGPLAGPVVSAAVILKSNTYIEGLNDSKKISENKRASLYESISKEAIAIGIGKIDSDEIDHINIYEATKKSMLMAVRSLKTEPEILFIDAMKLHSIYPERSFIKGDAISVSIAAASIIAKVTRDQIMLDYDRRYPEYGFKQHMGYGTKAHLDAIRKYGPCPVHRKSFEPVKSMMT